MSLRVEAGFHHLKDALATVFAEVVEFPPGVLVTVLDSKITANTAHAKIILSVFPETAEKEVIAILKERDADIKDSLTDHLRLRRVPRLHYTFDKSLAHVGAIDRVIEELKEKGEIEET